MQGTAGKRSAKSPTYTKGRVKRGVAPAARFHILMIDLNDPGLVEERRRRYALQMRLRKLEKAVGDDAGVKKAIAEVQDLIKDAIPLVPPPPEWWGDPYPDD